MKPLYLVDLPVSSSGALGPDAGPFAKITCTAGVVLAIYDEKWKAMNLAADTQGARVREIPADCGYWPAILGEVIN